MSAGEEGLAGGDPLRLPGPLNFSGLIATSFRAYRSLFGRLLIIGFVCFGIADLIEITVLTLTQVRETATISSSLRFLLSLSAYLFLGSFLVAFVSVGVADRAAGLPVTVGSMWRSRPAASDRGASGVGSTLKEVVASNLFAVVIGLTLVVLLAAFPFLFLPLFFGPPLVIQIVTLERLRLQSALGRMRQLASGNWAKTILYLLCVAIGARLLQGAVLDGTWIATRGLADAEILRATIFVIIRVLVEAATAAFVGVMATYVYFDLRARNEDYGPEDLRADRNPT